MSHREISEIRDPIHGYIEIEEDEMKIIDTPIFQRLRRIRQLSGAHITYPGAQHTRFDHLIGSMYLARLTIEKLIKKIGIETSYRNEVKIAALLHDLGHGPFSHLFDEILFDKYKISHEDLTKRAIRETEIRDIIQSNSYNVDTISSLAIGLAKNRPEYLNDLIGGALSVDTMDYLLRDSYFTGVEYGQVDIHRIINSFDIINNYLVLNQAALYAFEALMISRYEMFRAVYFHRTVRASEIMLIRAITLADDLLNLTKMEDISNYLSLTDELTLSKLIELDTNGKKDLKEAKQLAIDYRDRRLIKCVFEKFVQRKDAFLEKVFFQKKIREKLSEDIAQKADVEPVKVYVDVPTTPSVPFTSSKEAMNSLKLISENKKDGHQEIDVSKLPLIGAISGYMDIIRVYTERNYIEKVKNATFKVFGDQVTDPWWKGASY